MREPWMDRVERWAKKAQAWATRLGDRYECFLERRHWASRRRYVAFLRRSADEIEHLWPHKAALQRRKADALEREGLEITLRIDPADREEDQ